MLGPTANESVDADGKKDDETVYALKPHGVRRRAQALQESRLISRRAARLTRSPHAAPPRARHPPGGWPPFVKIPNARASRRRLAGDDARQPRPSAPDSREAFF